MTLSILPPAANVDATLKNVRLELKDAKGEPLTRDNDLLNVLAEFEKLAAANKDPFVSVDIAPPLPLGSVRALYQALAALDNERGIRLEAPPAGHLFYRAFFPNEQWRDRKQRLGRPWELRFTKGSCGSIARLELPADDIDRENGKTDQSFDATSPGEVAKILAEKSDRWSQSVYIFADDSMTYGELMTYILPSMKSHPTMWVFPPAPQR